MLYIKKWTAKNIFFKIYINFIAIVGESQLLKKIIFHIFHIQLQCIQQNVYTCTDYIQKE